MIFLLIMSRLAGKPLTNFVRERHGQIRKDLDEAAHLRNQALSQLREYERKVEQVDVEIQNLLTGIRKEAEGEKERIIAAAREQAQRLKTDSERQIAAEIERARRELRQEVVEAAAAAAEEALRKEMNADDQKRMTNEYVSQLEGWARGRLG
jgi:F-type H+-transporting ATPase subunit b